jgi:Uma2 family endonuclease
MSADAVALPAVEIDYNQFVTEDNEPLDGFFQERQQRLLTEILYASWQPPGGKSWVAAANVGVFFAVRSPAIVPDVFLAVGVPGIEDITTQKGQSYFIWDQGKPPDVVVEVVSRTPGGEDTDKLDRYGQIGVPWYVIYDPYGYLSDEPLRVYERRKKGLTRTADQTYPELNLGVTVWNGEYEGMDFGWLRWTDATGQMLSTKFEVAEAATKRANAADERANAADERANLEAKRAEQVTKQRDDAMEKTKRLEDALRKSGLDPDQV